MAGTPRQPLNVTFVIPYFYPALQYGGTPQSAYQLARALVKRGHNVKVLTTDSAGDARLPSGRRSVDGIDVIYYRNTSNWLAFQRFFWPVRMFRELERQLSDSDILHIHELRSSLTVAAYGAARRRGLPYVLSGHGGLRHLGRKSIKVLFDAIWGGRILRDAAAVIAISPVEERDAQSMNVDRERIQRLPNMVFAVDYQSLPAKGLFRERWRLGSDKVVLFLGRLHWLKGADLLVRAFHKIRASRSDVRLVIAGPDDGQQSQLRQMAAHFGFENAAVFTGFLDHGEKLQAFVDADLLVVPSRSDVFAITAVEALLCGCPVVLSDACGLHPMPAAENGARVFKNGDIDDLAARISMSLQESGSRAAAQKGREFVISEFGSERVSETAESIYRKVLRG